MLRIAPFTEALRRFEFEKFMDPEGEGAYYTFQDGLGNDYVVHFLPLLDRPGCFELEYLTQEFDYQAMTAGFIPFSISNTVFGDILSDFAEHPGFSEIVIRPTDKRRSALYLRTIRARFRPPGWRINVDAKGDITLCRR